MKWKILFVFSFFIILACIGINFYYKSNNNEIGKIEENKKIVGIVLPHHNVVAKKRLEFLELIADKKQNIKKIILISPDHYSTQFQKEISCSNRNWELSNGNLGYDWQLGEIICQGFEFRNNLIKDDHGIYNVLPDIKSIWPDSKVVPILIGQKMELEELGELVNRINDNCGEDCHLITSVDFSHYLPYALADIHDRKTERIMNNLDSFKIDDLEVDSPQSLYVLTQIAKLNRAFWNKYFHSNSTKLEGDQDKEGTSHFMGYYEIVLGNFEKNNDLTYCVGRFNEENLTIEELKEKNSDSVGERFFYGVDYIDFNIDKELVLDDGIKFISSEKADFDRENKIINLSKDLVVCGIVGENPLFLPIYKEDGRVFLKRGEEKEKYFEEFDIVK